MKEACCILLVDDDVTLLELFSTVLRAEGHRVLTADTGARALQIAKECKPDLLLLDVLLPDVSGIEVCREIKADPQLADAFVVLCTGAAKSVGEKLEGLKAGAEDYLEKAFELEELKARVRTFARLHDSSVALRNSERHYRALFEGSPVAVMLADIDGNILDVNEAQCRLSGYSRGELIGKSARKLVPPNGYARFDENLRALKNHGRLEQEVENVCKNGSLRQVELRETLCTLPDGQRGILCLATDITEQKRTLNALRSSEERFRQVTENITEVFWMTDLDKREMLYVSRAYEVIWCRPCADLYAAPQSWLDAIHPEDRDRVLNSALTRQVEGSYDEVYRVQRPDGSLRWIRDRAFPIRDEAGKIYRIVGIATDITDQKKAEIALRESEARKSAVVSSALDGIITFDETGIITDFNPAAEGIFGHVRTAVVGKSMADVIVPPNLRERHRRSMAQYLATGESTILGKRIELTGLHANGTEFPMELAVCRLESSPPEFTGFIRDVSEQKLAERRLAAQHAVIRTLAEAETLVEAAQKIVQSVCECLNWEAGAIWHLDEKANVLQCVDVWGSPSLPSADFINITRARVYKMGEGLPGRVWSQSKAVWIPDVLTEPNFPRGPVASQSGLHAAFGFPILVQKKVIGTIEFFSRQIREPDERLLELMSGLGGQIGQFIARKRTEEALRKAEANYRGIFANAIEGIFQSTPDGRYLTVNPALARILGYDSPEEVIASITNIGEQLCVEPKSRIRLTRLLEQEGYVRDFENRIFRKDRSVIWVSINVRVVRDAQGELLYYEGTNQDITRRKHAEEALRQSEIRKSAIVEAALDGIITIDHEGRIIEFNSAAEKMFGHSRHNVLGRKLAAGLIVPSLQPWFERGLANAFSIDEGPVLGTPVEIKALRADGSEFPIELAITRVELGDSPIYTAFVRDLTQREKTKARLTMLAHAVESTAEPICISDNQNRLLFANPAYQKTYGYAEREVLGKSLTLFLSQKIPASVIQEIEQETHRGGWQGEALAQRKDGTEMPVFLRTAPVRDSVGRTVGWMCLGQDITERKQSEARRAAFSSLGKRLSAASTSREAAQIIVDIADDLFGWDSCHLRLFTPGHDQMVPVLAYDLIEGKRKEIIPDRRSIHPTAIMRYITKHGAQLVGEGSPIAKEAPPSPFGDISRRSKSRMYVPLRGRESLLGIVSIQSYQANSYTEDDLQLLQDLADHCSGALERIKFAESLSESEQRFRTLFECAPIGIALHGMDGHCLSVNRAYQEMLGYSAEELKGMRANSLVFSDSKADVKSPFDQLGGIGRDSYRREAAYLTKSGRQLWTETLESVVRDQNGHMRYVISMVDDITERKRADSQIATLVHAVQSTTEPICITDLNDQFTFVNRAFQKAYGYTEAEILGQVPTILFSPRNPPALMNEILEQTRAGGWQGEVLDRRKDGSEFPIHLSTSRITDGSGRVLGLMGVAQDITERKRADVQIRLLADAVQSTHELISIADHQNRFTFVNRAFLECYGYMLAEIIGRTPEFLYSVRNPPKLSDEVFQQTLRGGWRGEILNRRKDGTELPISLSTSEIKDATGKTIGLVGVARDISERKRTEKQTTAFALLGYRLSAASGIEHACQIIIEVASVLFGWDASYVHLYSRKEDKIIPVLTMDTLSGQRTAIHPTSFTLDPSPLMREIMKDGARLVNRDRATMKSDEFIAFGDTHRRSASMMYVPIHSSGEVLGILSIQSYTWSAYTQKDLQVLQILADHCGDALQRIEVTEALRAAEAKFRSIFENATEGIFQTTPEGRYRSANPALAHILGFESPEELMSRVTDIERQTYVRPQNREELKQLLESNGSIRAFEVERYRKDGRRIWMSINGRVVRDGDGRVLYYEGTNQDVTDRKRYEEELRLLPQRIIEAQEVERLRVARELHDGVNQILASAKMRLRKVEERLGVISPAAKEILSRCSDLLVRALEENRRIAYNLRPSDLDELGLPSACRNLLKDFQSRSMINVKCLFPRNWHRQSPATELNLFRIVQEALNNVEKHSRARNLWIRLAIQDHTVVLKIRDDGRGFDQKNPKSNGGKRRGIGLTNIRERASSVGGTCEVMSALKQGTHIIVRAPYLLSQ